MANISLIVGLGNPGRKYTKTRHNAGFLFLDFLSDEELLPDFKLREKFHASISTATLENGDAVFAKPQTFMNESGRAVQALLKFYKLKPKDLLVIHDDKDLPFGTVRFKKSGLESGDGGHNGVKSIIAALGTSTFARLKIGVANDHLYKKDTADFVLEKFTAEEEKKLPDLFLQAKKSAESYL